MDIDGVQNLVASGVLSIRDDDLMPGEGEYYDDLVQRFIHIYKDGDEGPLDGDDVDRITQIFHVKALRDQGCITDEEYEELLDKRGRYLYFNKEKVLQDREEFVKAKEEVNFEL